VGRVYRLAAQRRARRREIDSREVAWWFPEDDV
jgi:hypothetical protein